MHNLATSDHPLDIETICKIHAILGRDLENNGGVAGQIRNTDIGSGEKNYIPGRMVNQKMNQFEAWFKEQIKKCDDKEADPVEFSALAYQRLVSIHPFSDANGRCCRMVMDYVLVRYGYPPAELAVENVSVAVFPELPDTDANNVHPKQAIRGLYDGVKKSLMVFNNLK